MRLRVGGVLGFVTCALRGPTLESVHHCWAAVEDPVAHSQDVNQLPHEDHGPVGSSGPPVVICDADPLSWQSLDLDEALAPKSLLAMPQHAGCHCLIDIVVWLGDPAKLPLYLCIAPDCSEVSSLLLRPAGALGHCLQCWGGCNHSYYQAPKGQGLLVLAVLAVNL